MSPGIVRRFWWRTDQRARLALACLGVLAVLAVMGALGFSGDARPEVLASTPTAAVHRGDSFEVTVRTVTEVDRFEGVEADTGRQVGARVAGVSPADCWQTQSRAAAETLLRGKTVRLTVKTEGENELLVDVRLPDGTDYARAVVSEGAAFADLAVRGELAPVEAEARKQRRGLWSTGCNGPADDALVAPSSLPVTSSSTPAPTTTTTPPPVVTTTRQPPKPPIVTIEPPSDDEWLARFVGKRCFPEGARRASPEGTEIVCARGDRGQLRWQRAD